MKFINYFQYNSYVVLTFFFLSFFVLIINFLSGGKSNEILFSSYRSSLLNPLTYVRMITHVLGHSNWEHFMNNFLYILLIGPMIEEKYGSLNLLLMIFVTAVVSAIVHAIFSKKIILGASGIVFMFIVLSSFVNIQSGKVPVTLVLICLFYIINEIMAVCKRDSVSHLSHIVGAICGAFYGFFW